MSDAEKGQASQTTSHSQLVLDYNHTPNVASQQPRQIKIANPGALGLFSFASTLFILSLYNVNARHIHTPNVIIGMACFSGGLAQFMAGMWEFPCGRIFEATVFTSFGAFWMSYATIFIPGSGILSAYTSVEELSQAIGIYLITWFVLTFFFLLGSLRRSIAIMVTFLFADVTFAVLAFSAFNGSVSLNKAGGWLGIITACGAFYCGLSRLLVKEESWFTVPLFPIKQRHAD